MDTYTKAQKAYALTEIDGRLTCATAKRLTVRSTGIKTIETELDKLIDALLERRTIITNS